MDFKFFVFLSTVILTYGILFLTAESSEKENGQNFMREIWIALNNRERWPIYLLLIVFSFAFAVSAALGLVLNPLGRSVVILVEFLLILWGWNIIKYHEKLMFKIVLSPDGKVLHAEGLTNKQRKCIEKRAKEIAEIFSFCCKTPKGINNSNYLMLQAECNKYVPFCLAGNGVQVRCRGKSGNAKCLPASDEQERLIRILKECSINVSKIA